MQGDRADAPDDGVDLPVAAGGRLSGKDDQQAKKVWVALERLDGGRADPRQMLAGPSDPPVPLGQVGEEALGAAFHDREQDAVLGAVVVVDGTHRDAGFGDHSGEGCRLEAVLGHHVLGGVEHEFARSHAAPVGVHRWVDGHGLRIAQELELTLQ